MNMPLENNHFDVSYISFFFGDFCYIAKDKRELRKMHFLDVTSQSSLRQVL